MKYSALLLIIFMATGSGWAATSAGQGATVYFISPQSGEIVQSPVTIKFGLKGMGVAPAGIDNANTGHHHLLIDIDQLRHC